MVGVTRFVLKGSTADAGSMKSVQANLASRIDKFCFVGLVHSVRISDQTLFDQIYVRFTTTISRQYRTLSKTIWLLKQSRLTEPLRVGIIRLVCKILHSVVRRRQLLLYFTYHAAGNKCFRGDHPYER